MSNDFFQQPFSNESKAPSQGGAPPPPPRRSNLTSSTATSRAGTTRMPSATASNGGYYTSKNSSMGSNSNSNSNSNSRPTGSYYPTDSSTNTNAAPAPSFQAYANPLGSNNTSSDNINASKASSLYGNSAPQQPVEVESTDQDDWFDQAQQSNENDPNNGEAVTGNGNVMHTSNNAASADGTQQNYMNPYVPNSNAAPANNSGQFTYNNVNEKVNTHVNGTLTNTNDIAKPNNSVPLRSESMEMFAGQMGGDSSSSMNMNMGSSFSGNISSGNMSGSTSAPAVQYDDDFANEPPLLEELGVNISHIKTKSLAVVLPVKYAKAVIDTSIMEDNDLAGPIAFGLLLATELLLAGKIHFEYIYGLSLLGCLLTTLVLNLMSPSNSISIWTVVSVLGYSLLPVNVLAAINVFYRIKFMGTVGVVLAALTIGWCTVSSTRLIERGCGMRDQRYLIGYPNALLYSAFVMMTIF